jgi:hypothetical protein
MPVPVTANVKAEVQVVFEVRTGVAAVATTPVTTPVAVVPRFVAVQAVVVSALAGTTDKSPNPRAATATADTFFNEIVFTIFLSFSRFQAFPGLGWWSKRPPH